MKKLTQKQLATAKIEAVLEDELRNEEKIYRDEKFVFMPAAVPAVPAVPAAILSIQAELIEALSITTSVEEIKSVNASFAERFARAKREEEFQVRQAAYIEALASGVDQDAAFLAAFPETKIVIGSPTNRSGKPQENSNASILLRQVKDGKLTCKADFDLLKSDGYKHAYSAFKSWCKKVHGIELA